MPLKVKTGGAYKNMANGKVKVNGAWKQALEFLVKENGKWKQVWKNETVFVLDKANASSGTFTVAVSGITSSSNKVALEKVRLVVKDDGYNRTTTYDKYEMPYNGSSIEYKTSSNAVGARITITAKPTNTVEFFIDIQRNSVDRVEFAFSKIYKI